MTRDIPIKEIVIEWHYEPKDYFEDRMIIEDEKHRILIDSGRAEAKLFPINPKDIDESIGEICKELESMFQAVQVSTRQPYELSEPERYDVREDGVEIRIVKAGHLATIAFFCPKVDIIQMDANGNILKSSKQERVDEERWFAETAFKFGVNDNTLDQMLKSNNASVLDPQNELIYLYEIIDAAKKKFQKAHKARAELNITKEEWKELTRISNNEPFTQGRHRGQNPGNLRDATIDELQQARGVASKIIKQYMKYLEKQSDS